MYLQSNADDRASSVSNVRTNPGAQVLRLLRNFFWELTVMIFSILRSLFVGKKTHLVLPCFPFPSQKRTLWMCGATVKKWKQRYVILSKGSSQAMDM